MSKIKRVPLGEVAEFINGVAFKPEDWSDDGKRIIRIQNLTDSSKPYNCTTRVVHEKYHVHRGDLLVSWSATLGVFVWDQPDIGLVNQHIFRVVPNSDCVDANYLRQMLIDALVEMERHLHGATMKHVNRGEFVATTIPLPPLAEQKRIARILDAADALRAKRGEALAQLDALLQSTFLTLFGDPVTNPMGWEDSTLGDLFESIRNGVNANQTEDNEGKWAVSRIETIWNGTIDSSRVKWTDPDPNLLDAFQLNVGDILFSHINSPEHIAKTAIYMGEPKMLIHGINLLRIGVDRKRVDPIWMLHFLKLPTTRTHFRTRCKKAVNQASLNQADIKGFPAYLPPLPLQQKFARIVESVERQKAAQRAHLAELDALFASLQHRAFRGEL